MLRLAHACRGVSRRMQGERTRIRIERKERNRESKNYSAPDESPFASES